MIYISMSNSQMNCKNCQQAMVVRHAHLETCWWVENLFYKNQTNPLMKYGSADSYDEKAIEGPTTCSRTGNDTPHCMTNICLRMS